MKFWELRKLGECARIVKSADVDGWPRHWACCAPTGGPAYSYCKTCETALFIPPKVPLKELLRSFRKVA